MNILVLANKVPYPPNDGGAIATINMCIGLANNSNKLTLLAMSTPKHFIKTNNIPKWILKKMEVEIVYVDTKIKLHKLLKNLFFSKHPYNAERFISDIYQKKLISLLSNNKYDIIQLEGLYLSPYIKTIRKHTNSRISFRAHNIEYEIWQKLNINEKNIIKKVYLNILSKRIKKFELSIINKYDLLVAITKNDLLKFEQFGNNKPYNICQTGLDINKYTPDNNKTEFPTLFHIGGLDWIPNREGILWFINNCWNVLIKQNPELKFYIAGRNAPKSFIDKLNYKNIIFLGEVENAKEFINSKAIMVVPLLSGSGMRIKIIEGMAMQKFIISTSIGAQGIGHKNNDNIIIADSGKDFIDAINLAINNKTVYKTIKKNAREFIIKNFDNFEISKSLSEFYNL